MPLPIAGEIEVVVGSVTPVVIHGDSYLDLAIFPAGDPQATMVRVPRHTFPPDDRGDAWTPVVGERIVVRVLLGQVDGVRRVSED